MLESVIQIIYPVGIIEKFNNNFNPNEIKGTEWEPLFPKEESILYKYWKRLNKKGLVL